MTRSTYRLQLNEELTFFDAAEVAPHLADLGVTHLYASPMFQAAPGSTHGYDVTDPTRLSEQLGGAGGFAALLAELRRCGLGLVADIVPNHMATDPSNPWWWDVLEDGPSSAHARAFDIDWYGGRHPSASTVLVPILDDQYGRVVESGRITLGRDGGAFTVRFEDRRLPLSPRTLDDVLGPASRAAGSVELADLAEAFGTLPDARHTDPGAAEERHRAKRQLADRLTDLLGADPRAAEATDAELARIGADPDRLDALLQRQNYRLAHWRIASDELDYRRFFNIDALIGVRVEDPATFDATHALVLDLVADGSIDGLRVDHVDGLRDPAGYLDRLAEASGATPTVVEKILAHGEELPAWPVAGTSGYDFLARVGQLFVDQRSELAMTDCYVEATGAEPDFATVARDAKRYVMARELVAEVDRATELLAQVCDGHRRHRDHTRRDLRTALTELIAGLDVYRTYWRPGQPPRWADVEVLERARDRAAEARPDIDGELLGFLTDVAAGRGAEGLEQELCLRFQQLSSPVMAKGVEDTAFYRYHRLISLNEVGDDPGTFGQGPDAFHAATAATASRWPDTMLTLSTHDTKRSADVRARISALAEDPERWRHEVLAWMERHEHHWGDAEPDRNTEYLLYQTLLGAWPVHVDRVSAFVTKAVREAKVHTSWTDPDEGYEAAVDGFVRAVLDDPAAVGRIEGFLADTSLVTRGRCSSLAQLALLLTCPGQPDLYQGGERWDLSLADPDNRRPVDFHAARRGLDAVRGCDAAGALGAEADVEGAPKLWLARRLLHLRRDRPDLFDHEGYEPIDVDGSGAVAFRRGGLVVVVPCRSTGPAPSATLSLAGGTWTDQVSGRTVAAGTHRVSDLLSAFPAAVLVAEDR